MTIIYAIKLAKNNFSNLSSDGFENLLQCTQELKNTGLVDVTCDHLKSQNKFELAEIIKKIADLDEHYICNFQENNKHWCTGIRIVFLFKLVKINLHWLSTVTVTYLKKKQKKQFGLYVSSLGRIRIRINNIMEPDPNYFNSDPRHFTQCCGAEIQF